MSSHIHSSSGRAVIATDRRALLQMALLAPFAVSHRARAAGAQSAALDPILTLNNGLLAVMKTGKSVPFVDRYNTLSPVVENTFDLPEVLRRCVGPGWGTLAATEQAELLKVFQRLTITSYVASFNSYAGQRFEVEPSPRAVGADVIVETHLVPLNGEPSRLDYMLHAQGSMWRVVDVLLDGTISRVAVQRSDFRRFLASHDSSGLISSMQQKIVSLSNGAVQS